MLKPRQELSEEQLKDALDACAREPIHIPASIQTHGCLLAIDRESHAIKHVSLNIERFTGVSPEACLQKKAEDVLGPECMTLINSIVVEHELQPIQSSKITLKDVTYDIVAHISGTCLIIELEPQNLMQDKGVRPFYDDTRNFAVGIHKAQELQGLYDHVVTSIRAVTGFDRVKLYRFDPEWNGSVIAEAKADFMPSYLGMRFPASDIPEQARILYTKNYLRLIPDIHYAPVPITPALTPGSNAPLDMSLAMLRSVSPVHIQYLDNMRIRASMSVSIIQNGQLWGLIACHNNSPLYVPYQARMVAEIMGHIFSAQLSTMENHVKKEERDAQAQFIERLNTALEKNYQFEKLLETTKDLALSSMKADGIVATASNKIFKYGDVPDDASIAHLMEWLGKNQNQIIFTTTDATEITELPNIHGGFLSASISQNRDDFVIWFRSSLVEDVSWAGNPEKPLEETKAGYRLTPRGSFELWKQSVRHRCEAWTYDNTDTARNFVNVVLEGKKIAAEQANMAKSEFLANMSHEIRTPMNAVIGLATILERSRPLTSQQKKFIDTLQTSAGSLLSLINDLLDISKIEAREMKLEHIPFNMGHVIQQVISLVSSKAQEKNLHLRVEDDCVRQTVYVGDPSRMRQIMLNLCSNAIKFTDRGYVSLAVTCEDMGSGQEQVTIKVADSGIGIAASKLGRIFNKFEQADNSISRQFGGTGLGLAITKSLSEAMGGSVSVESVQGQGSTFTVTLPLEKAAPGDAPVALAASGPVAPLAKKNKVVLLVEDHQPNVLVAGIFLEEFGYDYEVATNGPQAFDMARERSYHAILMDVQMAGLNGFETTQLIREYEAKHGNKPAYIIGMTAHALAGDRERCIAAGMNEYVSKPFEPDLLEEKLLGAS